MQIRRQNRIQETLEFYMGEATAPALTVNVDLNTDEMSGAAQKAWDVLSVATVELQRTPERVKAQENYGRAVIALFSVIFGEQDARRVLEFYEGRSEEMLVDLAPFFTEVMEKVQAARNARISQFLALSGKGKAAAMRAEIAQNAALRSTQEG